MNPRRPEIWGYRDARAFVGDLCAWKKQNESGFSFRKLSQLADLGSPNYVQTFLSGTRNLSRRTSPKLAEALLLSSDESRYFLLLLNLTQAIDPDEKRKWYLELLQEAVRHGTGTLDRARLDYFAEWYISVIHAMASLYTFRPDPEWIAERVVPRISTEEANRALRTLQQLDILEVTGNRFVIYEQRLETEAGMKSIWIREYHRSMINLSLRALDLWTAEDRVTSAATVTVPRLAMREVLGWVDEYRQQIFARIMALQNEMKGVDGEVMQINFQAFAVTRNTANCESTVATNTLNERKRSEPND